MATLSIFKGPKVVNTDEQRSAENRAFIKEKFIRMKSGNVDENALYTAIDELLPYLYKKNDD